MKSLHKGVIGGALISLLVLAILAAVFFMQRAAPPQKVPLADGRILQIEAVTFGTNHDVGMRSPIFDRLGPWLPSAFRKALEPKHPHSHVKTSHPALVVWVNATDAGGKSVDPQAVRVEFDDEHGQIFGEEDRAWFGFGNFSRVAHQFHVYPRDQHKLTIRLTPWRTNQSSVATIPNPRAQVSAHWEGDPLPCHRRIANMDIVLDHLVLRTNQASYYETPTHYWEPAWEFRQEGAPAFGWDEPKWIAEDPLGNRGKFLGIHQPVLRYSATFYPSATNAAAAVVIGRLPQIAMRAMQSNISWNTTFAYESTEVLALGVFPPGVNTFTCGVYDTNPAVTLTAVGGGAPSGWTSISKRITPLKVQSWHGHYTPVAVIYLKAPKLLADIRIGVRLLDNEGQYWIAKPEPQGIRDDVRPFLVELATETKFVTPEIVILKPVQGSFQVRTPSPQ